MPSLRTIAERLSRGRSFWRRMPAPFDSAKVLVTPDASLKLMKVSSAWYDPELMRIVERFVKPGSVVWDVGANLGLFGVASAVRAGTAGKVLCVEPDIYLAGLIKRSAARLPDHAAKLEVLPTALSNKAGVATFVIAERGRAGNSLEGFGCSQQGGVRERVLVPLLTVDMLLETMPAPDVLKIDVEGAETLLFQGATAMLRDHKPTLYFECEEKNVTACTEIMRANGYRLYDPNTFAEVPTCVWNTLAVHSSKAAPAM